MRKKRHRPGSSQPPPRVNAAEPRQLVNIAAARLILGIGILALFVPLIVDSSFFFPFVFLKNILFRAAVELMLLLYMVLVFRDPAYRPKLSLLSCALLAWFGVMLISSVPGISVDPGSSWLGDFRRMGGMIAQLHLLAYFFVLSQTLKRARDWHILLTAALFSGVLMGFSGMIQYLNLDYLYPFRETSRIEGAAGNANFFADALLLDFFLVLWCLGLKDKRSAYAMMAGVWLSLLGLLDLSVLGWGAIAGSGIISGLASLPVALFVLFLHAASLGWYFLRRKVFAGQAILVLLGAWFLFWMYQTQTRGAMVGLAGGLLFLTVMLWWVSRSGKAKLAWGAALLLAMLAPSVVYVSREAAWVQSHPTLVRYTRFSLADPSSENRIMAWKASGGAILDRPLFGWGLENFRNAFDRHFPVEIYRSLTAESWFDRAHNLIVDVSTTTGLAGLAAYGGFFLLTVFFLWRLWLRGRNPAESVLPLALIVAYLIQGLFSFDTVNTDVILFLALAYIAWLHANPAGTEGETRQKAAPAPPGRREWTLAALVVLLVPAGWVYGVDRPFHSNRLLQQARISSRVRPAGESASRIVFNDDLLNLFRRADQYDTTGKHDIHETFAEYAFELAHMPYIPPEQKLRAVEEAVRFLQESIRQSPSNARYYLYFASLVNGTNELARSRDPQLANRRAEAALGALEKAEPLCPNRPQIYLERNQTLAFLGRTEERIAGLEKLADLCPWFKAARIDLTALYISAGRYQEAGREWRETKARGFVLDRKDYNQVINAYEERKEFASIVALYQEQLQASPDDGTLWAGLAAAYRASGETELARKAALKSAALSPEAAAELQKFLDSLKK